MASNIEVFVGTYEEFILGYKVVQSQNGSSYKFSLIFSSRDHAGSIRCVSVSNKLIATGSADEKIVVYDRMKGCIVQMLIGHAGTVNTVAFSPDGTHIFSGSADGQIIGTRTGTWVTEKIFKNAHRGQPVNVITIHPTGKLALSLGNDLILRTWNLVRGRQAYATNLSKTNEHSNISECLSWSLDGEHFALTAGTLIQIWIVDTAKVIKEKRVESKAISLCWMTSYELYIGLDNGDIVYYNITSENSIVIKASDTRIKDIKFINNHIVSVASSGDIVLWKVQEDNYLEKLCSTNIGCRPTCLEVMEISESESSNEKEPESAEVDAIPQKTKTKNLTGSVTVEVEEDSLTAVKSKEKKSKKKKFSSMEGDPEYSELKTNTKHKQDLLEKEGKSTSDNKFDFEEADNHKHKLKKKHLLNQTLPIISDKIKAKKSKKMRKSLN